MQAYIIRRLYQAVYVLVALSIIVFAAVRFAPGNPSISCAWRLCLDARR